MAQPIPEGSCDWGCGLPASVAVEVMEYVPPGWVHCGVYCSHHAANLLTDRRTFRRATPPRPRLADWSSWCPVILASQADDGVVEYRYAEPAEMGAWWQSHTEAIA